MSGFAPDWLRLREAIDHRSRDVELLAKLARHFENRPEIRVVGSWSRARLQSSRNLFGTANAAALVARRSRSAIAFRSDRDNCRVGGFGASDHKRPRSDKERPLATRGAAASRPCGGSRRLERLHPRSRHCCRIVRSGLRRNGSKNLSRRSFGRKSSSTRFSPMTRKRSGSLHTRPTAQCRLPSKVTSDATRALARQRRTGHGSPCRSAGRARDTRCYGRQARGGSGTMTVS